jgi:hypothetical protein
MRVMALMFASVLGMVALPEARQSEPPSPPRTWDAAVTVAAAEARSDQRDTRYWDNWYFQDRYALMLGRYWTEHLKTELEYARSGEGSTYFQEFVRLPGSENTVPISGERFHRLEQLALRVTWQFGHNTWMHPYVSAGVVGDRERRRAHLPAQYAYPIGRERVPIAGESSNGPTWQYRIGVTADAGAKFYVSRHSFIKAGVNWTFSNPAQTFNLFAGVGIDF